MYIAKHGSTSEGHTSDRISIKRRSTAFHASMPEEATGELR
jgi:hypothetical protein